MFVYAAIVALSLTLQSETGELRLAVSDPAGLAVNVVLELTSEANQFHGQYRTDSLGRAVARRLSFGRYVVSIDRAGFAPFRSVVEVRSSIPQELQVRLTVAPLSTSVTVTGADTLIDGQRTSLVHRIGSSTIENRTPSLPGRSFLDLVATQPGWLLEANGILHPRGSEYQVQYVIDGLPLTDNRSPAFMPDPDANGVAALSVLTAGYPAEYGRKLGGVVEVVTAKDATRGLHGQASVYGGALATFGGSALASYRTAAGSLQASVDGGATDRFLDPPVLANYANHGSTSSASARYERDWRDTDRAAFSIRHTGARFLVPNETAQEEAGQRQERRSHETAGVLSYQRLLSRNALGEFKGLFRQIGADLESNSASTPIVADQSRRYREVYGKGVVTLQRGSHEFRFGGEAAIANIEESLDLLVTDPQAFEPSTPREFAFTGRSPDREFALFVQDRFRLNNWTASLGLRCDRYSVTVTEQMWSPRLSVAYFLPTANLVVRGSYDRIFQTPAFENLLVASSPAVDSLSDQVLRLPVRPSRGHFFDLGFSKSLGGRARLDVSAYWRNLTNFADDDLLLNTGVGFPTTFQSATVRGAEARVDLPRWGRVSGAISYAYMVGEGSLPVTGGLFLGHEAAEVLENATGKFRLSQDQRHTLAGRLQYQLSHRASVALGGFYGSGLPTELGDDDETGHYDAAVLDRVDFGAGRVRPAFGFDTSLSVTLRQRIRARVDIVNVANRLNLINFAGLFSGTAIGSPRRVSLHVDVRF